MFDIGFMELLIIGIVALLVLGPDKLPGAIRTSALWIGRARRSFNKVKTEIEQQINADEIRRQLHNESILADIEKAKKNANKLLDDTRKSGEDIPAVTSSAVEGAPTEPPAKPADSSEPTKKSEEASASQANDKSPAITEPSARSEPSAKLEPSSGSGHSTDKVEPAATAPEVAPQKEPVYDFYNSPPTGRVSMQNGKFIPLDDNDDGEKK
jgi:sec-independent protein translocase protein TatB